MLSLDKDFGVVWAMPKRILAAEAARAANH
jgi:hypothetical protein